MEFKIGDRVTYDLAHAYWEGRAGNAKRAVRRGTVLEITPMGNLRIQWDGGHVHGLSREIASYDPAKMRHAEIEIMVN